MDTQKYMLKHSELELKNLGVQGRFDLRKNASDNEDLDTLQDVATYRFVNGSVAIYIDLLPELAYLYGKARRVNDLKALFNDYSWAMFGIPQSCIEKTNNMFDIGYTFPYLNENQLDYLEELWCDSSSFEWMDIIMYDSYLLPRKLNRFDKSQLEIIHTEFSDEFLYEIYNLFDEDKDEYDLPCYDRKSNSIIRKNYEDIGRGEYVIDYSGTFDQVSKHLTEEYGEECANYFAKLFMGQFYFEDIEKFKACNYVIVPPSLFIDKARLYFKNGNDIENLKKWFAKDFLQKCNELS